MGWLLGLKYLNNITTEYNHADNFLLQLYIAMLLK